MSEHTARAIRLFDALAAEYDEFVAFFSGFAMLHVDWLDPQPGTIALDLGSGSGALTGALLDRGCTVTAIDGAPAMMAKLAERHPAAETHVMDVHALAFPDASFDLVCAGFVMHILEDPARTAVEIHRVLRPGGAFSFSTPCDVKNAPEWDFYCTLFREYQPYVPKGQGRLGHALDAATLLATAGFDDLSQTVVEQHLAIPDPDTFWNWSRLPWQPSLHRRAPPKQRQEFESKLRAALSLITPTAATVARATKPTGTA